MLPIGLGARNTLRLEMAYALYGHEINRETTPYEAGLGWVVKPAGNKKTTTKTSKSDKLTNTDVKKCL